MKKLQDKYEIKETKEPNFDEINKRMTKKLEKVHLELARGEKQLFFTEEEVLEIVLEYHISQYYIYPDPEGSDHTKNRGLVKKWLKKHLKSKENA